MLATEDTMYVDQFVSKVNSALSQGDIATAQYITSNLLIEKRLLHLHSYIQHQLSMFAIKSYGGNITYPDIKYFDWLLDQTRDILQCQNVESVPNQKRLEFLLEWACERGNSAAAILLMEKYGADPTEQTNPFMLGNALDRAIYGGCTEAVEWMLNRGMPVNIVDGSRTVCVALIYAASYGRTDICRMLVERGAVINFINGNGLSPLTCAQANSHSETFDYLLSVGAQYPWQILGVPAPPPIDSRCETVAEHLFYIEDHDMDFGPIVEDATRPEMPIVVRRIDVRGGLCLLTDGMAKFTLPHSENSNFKRAELYTYVSLNANEQGGQDWPECHEQDFWIAEWLNKLAHYPHDYSEHLGPAAVLANGDPPEPLAPGVPFTCWLLVCYADRPISTWERRDGEVVRLYHAIPIYTAERDYERIHGTDALLQKFAEAGSERNISSERPCVV